MKNLTYERRDGVYVVRSAGGGSADTSTTLTEMYHDDELQFRRGFRGSDGYGGGGLGIAGMVKGPRENIGLVPSGRIREVIVGDADEHPPSESATPLNTEGMREIHHVDEGNFQYAEEENDFVTPQGSDEIWNSPLE